MLQFLEAKFPHAAVFCILPGYELPNGKRHYPVATMVANLAKPTPERPALMGHFEVTTLFHEMGHIFHELLSRTQYSRFHGTTVALDFAEAPSQMLENWSGASLFCDVVTNLEWVAFQVLGARSAEEDVEPLQDTRPIAGRPHHQDHQEVGIHVSNACISRMLSQMYAVATSMSGFSTCASSSTRPLISWYTTTVWTHIQTTPGCGTK